MCALRSAAGAFGNLKLTTLNVTHQGAHCRHLSMWRRRWRLPIDNGDALLRLWRSVISSRFARLSLVQLQFLAIQRVKRSLQIFEMYCNLYERDALCAMARSLGRKLTAQTRWALLGVSVFTTNNTTADIDNNKQQGQWPRWKRSLMLRSNCHVTEDCSADSKAVSAGSSCRGDPPESDVRHGFENEFDDFEKLIQNSVVCPDCNHRQIIDQKVDGVCYCQCDNGEPTRAVNRSPSCLWTPFLEKRGTIVWRKQHPVHPHLFSYKVYGSFSDISADTFCEVQLNTEYRAMWDSSVEQLRLIDASSSSPSPTTGKVATIYWLVRFPRMFANRDYVFERRHYRDEIDADVGSGGSCGQLTIVSCSVCHDKYPPQEGIVRVSDYWSVMVIRPHRHFDQPGMDFGLTYFDDPGTQLPAFVTNYVAASGLPDFLEKVAEAARHVQRQLNSNSVTIPLHYIQSNRSSRSDSGVGNGDSGGSRDSSKLSSRYRINAIS